MAALRLTPPLGAFGKYELKVPWVTNNNVSYRCVSLRRVEEIVKSGKNVFTTFYEPMKLSQEVANVDIAAGVVFVGLLGSDGSRIYVPDTYIESYPDQTAVTYDYTVLSIDLGPQPSNIDLAPLMDEIKTMASNFTGVDVDTIIVGLGAAASSTMMTNEQHQASEDARKLAISLNEPSTVKIARLTEANIEQDALIQTLLQQQNP